ncbi:restriction endonuclease subunit S [Flavobacterium sp.]|uniref:restriction endonuclease subunit S n=1 Tax=Flavobacterium sp. TaxID=239 RepID=UPI0022C4A77D|nr:restriction endonuclease subunit S [Flavobacterium sp.]MCZ8090681.1 restriction endonuclease subunit S [Flavobacterium sp.]
MSKIEQLIQQYCPDGVEYLKLSQVIKLEKGKQLNKELLTEFGDYPAYNGGLSYSGFTDKFNYEENKIIISQGGASAGFVNYVTTKFYANAHCYVVLPNVEIVLNRYVFHFLKLNQENLTSKQHGAGIPALKTSEILQIPIPIPPLPIQQEIVTILDKFTALEAELEAELEARSRQYEYYRNQLLAFEGKEVEWKTLGELTTLITKGTTPKKYTENGIAFIKTEAFDGSIINTKKLSFIDDETHNKELKRSILKHKDILITIAGATIGKCAIVQQEILPANTNQALAIIRLLENINNKYIFYILKSNHMAKYIEMNVKGSAQPNLNLQQLNDFKIPIPSLEEQERIVNILDQFDALVNDIKIGLPAEIKARRAQYEYYRKKLLTFKRESMNHQ